ncbi:MAG: nitrite reductase small subunit NirD [Deltaproteobacteria bacterium]|nr:nitrite reductase small subunit NirD [Deltaproteobacteria bacterium]
MQALAEIDTAQWVDTCSLEDIVPDTAACAWVNEQQVAIVRFGEDAVYAISNFDPFSRAFVLSRGIVGDKQGVPKIASPLYKQSFNLQTGQCLDDPSVGIPTYPVRVHRGRVQVLL